MIGIGITERNRPLVFERMYSELMKRLPPDCKVVIVDDCSDTPVPNATFRFETNVGIAAAKNMCFQLLDDCTDIFLFDSDTWPKVDNWWIPYVESKYNHLSFTFSGVHNRLPNGINAIRKGGDFIEYNGPCGCVLYYKKICLDVVGGMNEDYGLYCHEHPDHSTRIFNAGLTPYKFMDIPNSISLFHSLDYYLDVERSVPSNIRKQFIKRNNPIYESNKKSKEFIPYRPMTGMVITTYFTKFKDPQKGIEWEPNIEDIDPLFLSIVDKSETTLTVISDSFGYLGQGTHANFIKSECTMNPYLQRWVSILKYLKSVNEDYIFCVDATDVEMINNPFKENLGNYLWVGDEPSTINNEWLIKHHNQPIFGDFIHRHKNKTLLNAGVIGGRKSVVEDFITRLVWYIQNHEIWYTDMMLFNYVLYTEFADQIRHGRRVTNVFKSFNKQGEFFFAHK